jgi:hypothetical protein
MSWSQPLRSDASAKDLSLVTAEGPALPRENDPRARRPALSSAAR